MTDWITARTQVALAGRVTDAETGVPVVGAEVRLSSVPGDLERRLEVQEELGVGPFAPGPGLSLLERSGRLDRGTQPVGEHGRPPATRTAGDGSFYFVDLPAGAYTMRVAGGDYETAEPVGPGAGSRRYRAAEAQARVEVDDGTGDIRPESVEIELEPADG